MARRGVRKNAMKPPILPGGSGGLRERLMARNGRHAVLIFLLGIRHAEAFFCAAASPFRRRANTVVLVGQQNNCAPAIDPCFGVSDASPKLEGEQGVLPPHFQSVASVAWVQLMLDSFEETFAGQPLIRGLDRESLGREEQARQVAVADVAVVSHDFLRSEDDPIFIYGAKKRMANILIRAFMCSLCKSMVSFFQHVFLACFQGRDWLYCNASAATTVAVTATATATAT